MKTFGRILVLITVLILCIVVGSKAQINQRVKSIYFENADSATVRTNAANCGDCGFIYYNNQDTTNAKFRVYQDSVWYDLLSSGGGGGTPALPFNSVQFNNAGVFGGNANFTYNPTTPLLTSAGLNIFRNAAGSIGITDTGFSAPTSMGGSNVGVGSGTFNVINVAATGNTSIGVATGLKLTTGDDNTYLGNQAGQEITTGNRNTNIGANAGQGITTGSSNTFLGRLTGGSVTTESNNVLIGAAINIPTGGNDNQLSIQNAIYGINNSGTNTTVSTGRIGLYVSNPLARLHLPAGSSTALTAPLKFNSGALMSTAETGAFEFLTDKYYGTITTGAARKEFTLNDGSLTSGRLPFVTTNGRLTDDAGLTISSAQIMQSNANAGVNAITISNTNNSNTAYAATAYVNNVTTNYSGITSSTYNTIPFIGANRGFMAIQSSAGYAFSLPTSSDFKIGFNSVESFNNNSTRTNLTGNLVLTTAGNEIQIKEGTNAAMGASVLVGGTVTVNTTKVTATSRIQVTSNADGGTPGWLRVSARVAGTSFTITSSSGTDTSTVAWVILEPAP